MNNPLAKKRFSALADYPDEELLINGSIAKWLRDRTEELLISANEVKNGSGIAKSISLAGLALSIVISGINPLAGLSAILCAVGYSGAVLRDKSITNQVALLPFVRGNLLDILGTLGNADLRSQYKASSEIEDLQNYLGYKNRHELMLLSQNLLPLTEKLQGIEPDKRFDAYLWMVDKFVESSAGIAPQDITSELIPVIPKGVKEALPTQVKKADSNTHKANESFLPQNALDILQGLVTNADASKLGGCVILAAPGAGKTTFLGTAWGRLKETYGDRLNSLAIVVKRSDVKSFQGVSDNCLCVDASPRQAAIAILRFIENSKNKDNLIRRLFLDDFLTMNKYFEAALRGLYINPTTFDVVSSKKEDIDAQPFIETLHTALNQLWLVGRENNAALWVSSHSSNVDNLPFIGGSQARSVGEIIFLAKNDKREFIEQALNNPSLIGDNTKRQELKAELNSVEAIINEPLILANFNNWTFGIVPNEVHNEYQKFRKDWETVAPVAKLGEKLSDVIQGLEKSLELASESPEEKEETSGFDFNKAIEVLRALKGKDWQKVGDARAKSKPLRKVTRDADDIRLLVSFLQKDGEADLKEGDLFLILDKPS